MEIEDIKIELKKRHINYDKLSVMTGISKSAIAKIMSGIAKNPRIDTIRKIEKALDLENDPAPLVTPYLTEEEEEIVNIYKNLSERDKELFLTVARRMNSNTEKFRSMGRNIDEL